MDGPFIYVQPRGRIFIPRFLKKTGSNDFGVALLANNHYQRAWVRRQIDAAG
jgi:ABC-type microcin C transport system permease subunit YejE